MTSIAPRQGDRSLPPGPEAATGSDIAGPRTAGPEPDRGSLRRFSALDGIRALAVLAVLCYHAGISWTGGGLLGVDVFFVLSGFLITTLLCRELAGTGTIRLGRFWAQRARRLVPALLVLVFGVAAYAYVFRDSLDLGAVRADALSTLLYVANWHFIFSEQGYFAQAAAPSPFLHTWSLAVEEQYYLIWPLIALFVVRRWGIPRLALVAGVGAVASASLMLALYEAGSSIDRLYYGTDTRAQALLVGSFLGAVGAHAGERFSILPASWSATRRRRWLWSVPGVVGLAFLFWAWHALPGLDPVLYRGGFFLVAVAAGALIVSCVTVPSSLLARALSLRALVFVGRISYGLYLYHWPLFLWIDHAHTGLSGVRLLAVRLVATFAVATVSFVALEEPVRTGRLFHGWKGATVTATAALGAAAAMVLATVTPAAAVVAIPGGPSHRLPPSEHASLVAADAFTSRPIRFLIVGDSVALTLGVGLDVDPVKQFGVTILDGGQLGCDLDNVDVDLAGVVKLPTEGCLDWRSTWKAGVDRLRPDVVGMEIGRWEVSDHLYDGHWVHIGQPVWDDHLTAELDQAIDILSSDGAKVVLFTMPYVDPPEEAANGTPFSENDPARATAFNRLLEGIARRRSAVVTLVDLNRLLDPDGHYQAVVDGITVRWSDGVHISRSGGEWLQPDILPLVARLGLTARQSVTGP